MNRKTRRHYERMGATKARFPYTVTLGMYRRILAERGIEVDDFAGLPDTTLVQLLYDLPDGGGIVEVVA